MKTRELVLWLVVIFGAAAAFHVLTRRPPGSYQPPPPRTPPPPVSTPPAPPARRALGVGVEDRLRVVSVEAGSPAAAAGLREDDQVEQVEGRRAGADEVLSRLDGLGAGSRLVLTVRRSTGMPEEVTVTGPGPLGVTTAVPIREVYPGSAAAREGLEGGDWLVSVDGRAASPERLRARLEGLRPGEPVLLVVRRVTHELARIEVTLEAGDEFELGLARRLVRAAADQLLSHRRPDGLWPHYQDEGRSSVAVSALVAWALACAGDDLSPEAAAALADLRRALCTRLGDDGGLVDPGQLVPHRTYATALLLLALQGHEPSGEARLRLAGWLRRAQVHAAHGVDELDWRYGGWSYYEGYESASLRTDVSTERFALQALASVHGPGSARVPDDPVWRRARLWLELTQNQSLVTRPGDPAHDRERGLRDGGFGFTPRMSKAGDDPAAATLVVFRSYGTATADGLLAWLAVEGIDRRREAGGDLALPAPALGALRWLARAYTLSHNPGFGDDPVGWSRGLYLYYLAALADGLHRAGVWRIVDGSDGTAHEWPRELVRTLATVQRSRGRFRSDSGLMHEDCEPLAASFALLALAAARDRLALGGGADAVGVAAPPPLPLVPEPFDPPRDATGRGQAIFRQLECATCHRDDGLGNGPSLVGVSDRYLGALRAFGPASERLRAFLRAPSPALALTPGQWPAGAMPPLAGRVTEDELADLAAFLLGRTGRSPVADAPDLR